MRSLLLLSAVAAIVACSDNQSTTAVTANPGEVAASTQRSSNGVSAFGKPAGSGPVITVVIGTDVNIAAGASANAVAICPAGTSVTGGGYEYSAVGTDPSVWRNRELESEIGIASGWTVSARNTAPGAQTVTLTAWVSCAK